MRAVAASMKRNRRLDHSSHKRRMKGAAEQMACQNTGVLSGKSIKRTNEVFRSLQHSLVGVFQDEWLVDVVHHNSPSGIAA